MNNTTTTTIYDDAKKYESNIKLNWNVWKVDMSQYSTRFWLQYRTRVLIEVDPLLFVIYCNHFIL